MPAWTISGVYPPGTILRHRADLGVPAGAVVLTFDDGPNPHGDVTERLLRVLERRGVRAYFSVVGQQVEAYPRLTRAIHRAGHHLVNHSFAHEPPILRSYRSVQRDFDRCESALRTALGRPSYRSRYYRPPYGLVSRTVRALMARRQVSVLPVSFFVIDVLVGPDGRHKVLGRIEQALMRHRGGVVVLHERLHRKRDASARRQRIGNGPANRTWVPDAVDELIGRFRAQGYHFPEVEL